MEWEKTSWLTCPSFVSPSLTAPRDILNPCRWWCWHDIRSLSLKRVAVVEILVYFLYDERIPVYNLILPCHMLTSFLFTADMSCHKRVSDESPPLVFTFIHQVCYGKHRRLWLSSDAISSFRNQMNLSHRRSIMFDCFVSRLLINKMTGCSRICRRFSLNWREALLQCDTCGILSSMEARLECCCECWRCASISSAQSNVISIFLIREGFVFSLTTALLPSVINCGSVCVCAIAHLKLVLTNLSDSCWWFFQTLSGDISRGLPLWSPIFSSRS